jgi:hypothetical protein
MQSFSDFPNFYRHFIKGFSVIAQPLIAPTCKEAPFEWTTVTQTTFDLLKQAFTTAPVLLHPHLTKPFHVETDASDFTIWEILSQPDKVGMLHPMAYYSRKFTTPEINYLIYNKELCLIIDSFEEWKSYLAGVQHRIQVVTDHKNLIYFSTTQT